MPLVTSVLRSFSQRHSRKRIKEFPHMAAKPRLSVARQVMAASDKPDDLLPIAGALPGHSDHCRLLLAAPDMLGGADVVGAGRPGIPESQTASKTLRGMVLHRKDG